MWCSVVPCWNRPQLNSCSSLVFVALKRRTHGNHLVHRKHESPKSLGIATEEKARVSTLHLAGPWIVSELCTRMCIAGSMYKCITPLESSTRKGLAATAQLGASKNGGCIKKKACILATIFVAKVEPLWQFCTHPKRGFPSFQSTLLIRWFVDVDPWKLCQMWSGDMPGGRRNLRTVMVKQLDWSPWSWASHGTILIEDHQYWNLWWRLGIPHYKTLLYVSS